MARWKELMGRSVGVVIDAETAMVDFQPSISATLVEVEVIAGAIAATTLIENGYFKLVHSKWAGRDLYVPFQSIGLHTVPVGKKPENITKTNLPVAAGIPVKMFYYNNVAPTTPEFTVFGTFEG